MDNPQIHDDDPISQGTATGGASPGRAPQNWAEIDKAHGSYGRMKVESEKEKKLDFSTAVMEDYIQKGNVLFKLCGQRHPVIVTDHQAALKILENPGRNTFSERLSKHRQWPSRMASMLNSIRSPSTEESTATSEQIGPRKTQPVGRRREADREGSWTETPTILQQYRHPVLLRHLALEDSKDGRQLRAFVGAWTRL